MSVKKLMEVAERSGINEKRINSFKIGDTVDVHVKITEGEKERIQIFTGIVIAKNGTRITEAFTVRRLVGNEGVERVFPLHSPAIDKIDVKKSGKTRRAKLYYLRDRVGKATRLAEQLDGGVKPRASSAPKVAKAEKADEKAAPAKAEAAK